MYLFVFTYCIHLCVYVFWSKGQSWVGGELFVFTYCIQLCVYVCILEQGSELRRRWESVLFVLKTKFYIGIIEIEVDIFICICVFFV